MKSNLFITGFSGSGKTSVGREVAWRLGWLFVDTDDYIVRTTGKPIEAIFEEMGEDDFRRMEHECLADLCKRERQVIATGGGIVVDERNRRLMERSGVIVCLEARPEIIHKRLERQRRMGSEPAVRPMLSAPDPLERIRCLKEERQAQYALAHWTVHTDRLDAQQAAEEVVRAWKSLDQGETPANAADDELAAVVQTSSGDCPIWVGWGILDELGQRVRQMLAPSAAYIISDEGVYPHARQAQAAMESATIPTHLFLIPPGEPSKSLEMAQRIYDWLADRRAERGHLLLAVGGGVVGDMAGFVAATYLRGMPFVQVPTTLLAMTDAAIGGKVAVDLPQGKNLVGAFHQPRFVLSDVATLKTLPKRELASGWAEAIKHGLILDKGLVEVFERHGKAICGLEPEVATNVIRRSVRIKADVVSRDDKETLGVRVLLNYGHTIGHALEAATSYEGFLHGEAVSVGMMGAAYIGHAMGLLSAVEVERQRALLESYGLPLACGSVDTAGVEKAMLSDKKTSDKGIRWVLLDGIGHAVTRSDVPAEVVRETLGRLAR